MRRRTSPRRSASPRPRAAQVEYYALDNNLLRSKSTGIHLRTKPSILENDLSTPLIKWGTIIKGLRYVPDPEAEEGPATDEAVREAGLSLRDTYGRTIDIVSEPAEWLVVKGIRNLRGKMDGVTRPWYIPFDITHAPILLHKPGMEYEEDDYVDEEEEAERKKFDILPEPTDTPPFEIGRGMQYEVVYTSVVVRAAPSLGARAQSREMKGATVEMFDWDETRNWRAVYDKLRRVGWMMLDHHEFGALLRPKCLPYQVRPVEPMTAAVMEVDMHFLRKFVSMGMDVNTKDAGDRTPLMVAAEYGRHGPIVVLCASGADASLMNFNDKTAVDLAESQVTKALVQALTSDKHFDHELCQEAISGLKGDVRELAEELLGRKIARAKFFGPQDNKKEEAKVTKKASPGPMQRRPKVDKVVDRPLIAGADEDAAKDAAKPRVDVEALAVRGMCALCQCEFRQAIVAACCVALFCSDCVLKRLSAPGDDDEGCPGCGAEIPTTKLEFLRPDEAAEMIDTRLIKNRSKARKAAAEDRRQAKGAE